MKIRLFSMVVMAAFIACGNVCAQDGTKKFTLGKVRLLAKLGSEPDLAGARITGSNTNATNGFVELGTIKTAPASGEWVEVAVNSSRVFRYVKFEAAPTKVAALVEIEFYDADGNKMAGQPFGSAVPNGYGNDFSKAFDGKGTTYFEATTTDSYAGLDFGNESQSPAPRFEPQAGAQSSASVDVSLMTWPASKEIRYTIDGTEPSESSLLYENSITLDKTTSIAARAWMEGKSASNVVVATYIFGAEGDSASPQIKSYHIGNSLTDTINTTLSVIAQSGGKNLYYMRKTIPGCAIKMNWEENGKGFGSPEPWCNDYQRVLAEKVDHIWLQPFPNPPGVPMDGLYGGKFIALAREHNPAVQPWLYAQWPSKDSWKTDAHCVGAGWMTPPWFPSNREPKNWEEAMANKMEYYGEVFDDWNKVKGEKPVRLCPGGPALVLLKQAIEADKVPGIKDFFPSLFSDGIHLSRSGAYFIGLVAYACLFGESPEGKVTNAISGLTPEQAKIFQRIAWEAVLAEPRSGVKEKK